MQLSKFHDRSSLITGVVAGAFVSAVGVVLSLHCIDMLAYYKKHRIVKIEKIGDKRIVTKE